jgi:ketosteroid isomerase-like protein
MTTRETIEAYFDRLARRDRWDTLLAPDMVFTSHASPATHVSGRDAFLESTKRFYSMIGTVRVHDVIVDGSKACALTRYELAPPNGGPSFTSDVAEIFAVRDGLIGSLAIYFDTAPFPRPAPSPA